MDGLMEGSIHMFWHTRSDLKAEVIGEEVKDEKNDY